MGGTKTDRLTPDEAKARLRQAVSQLGVQAWVKRSPYEALAASFVAGLALAISHPLRHALARVFLRLL